LNKVRGGLKIMNGELRIEKWAVGLLEMSQKVWVLEMLVGLGWRNSGGFQLGRHGGVYPFVGYGRSSCGDLLFWVPDFEEDSLGRGSAAVALNILSRKEAERRRLISSFLRNGVLALLLGCFAA